VEGLGPLQYSCIARLHARSASILSRPIIPQQRGRSTVSSRLSKWSGRSVLAMIFVLASTLSAADSATAASATCQNGWPFNVHEGKGYDPPESSFKVRGAEASIETRNPDICTSENSFSGEWAMMFHEGGDGWAQVGYEKHKYTCGVCHRYFWQWTLDYNSSTVVTGMYGSPSTGSFHTYTVSRFTSDGLIRLKIDGQDVDCNNNDDCGVTFFDPEDWWTFGCGENVCINGEWFGETDWLENDLPGGPGTKADIADVMVKDGQTPGNWFQKPVNGSNYYTLADCDWGHQQNFTDNTGFWIWTDPSNHTGC
jgi:hypothetical protein